MPRLTIHLLVAGLLLIAATPVRAATPVDNAYLTGYVAAILEREFRLSQPEFRIDDGVVTLKRGDLNRATLEKIKTVLSQLDGVTEVRFVEEPLFVTPVPAQTAEASRSEPDQPADEIEFLPSGQLFEPLIADPRWPHFFASYQHFIDDDEVRNAGAVGFGETFGLLGGPAFQDGRWQIDFQAGVFALFDLDADSMDLINADYFVGIPVSLELGDFAAMARIFHISSHLGDEFLLRSRTDRVNLSFESVDLKLSYDLGPGFRPYGGAGYLIHKEPSDLDPWSTQAGLQFVSPYAFFGDVLRPVAAVDVQNRQESDWSSDISARLGVQLGSPQEVGQKLLLLLEYYNGKNPTDSSTNATWSISVSEFTSSFEVRLPGGYQPKVPGPPLKGPVMREVIQPP